MGKHFSPSMNVFIILILLQVDLYKGDNAGLYFHSLTNINQTCVRGPCAFYMDVCFSLSKNTCDLENFTSNAWNIGHGRPHDFGFLAPLGSSKDNPLKPGLNKWQNQPVSLNITIRENNTKALIERHYLHARLPYPVIKVNNMATILKNGTMKKSCGKSFCLNVTFYMWCTSVTCVATRNSSVYEKSSPIVLRGPSSRAIIITRTTIIQESFIQKKSVLSSISSLTQNQTTQLTTCSINCSTTSEPETSKNLFKKWWFLLAITAAGILVILALILLVLKYKKQRKIDTVIINVTSNDSQAMNMTVRMESAD